MRPRHFLLYLSLLTLLARAAFSIAGAAESRAAPDRKQIARWIAQLDDPDFDTRAAAKRALIEAGPVARQDLESALKSESTEVRTAAAALMEQFQWEKIPAALDYKDSMPLGALAMLHIPSVARLSDALSKTGGGALLKNATFMPVREWFAKYLAQPGHGGLAARWAARFKGQVAAALLGFNLFGGTVTWVVIAEMPGENADAMYREFLMDFGEPGESAEKLSAGLLIHSAKHGKVAATLAGCHLIFASDEETLLRTARSFVKPLYVSMLLSQEYKILKPVLPPGKLAVVLFNASAIVQRTMLVMGMLAGAANPKLKAEMDRVTALESKNAWFGATLGENGARLEESYFFASDEAAGHVYDFPAVKAGLKKRLSEAPRDAVILIGWLPQKSGKKDADSNPDNKAPFGPADFAALQKLQDQLSQYKNLSKLLEGNILDDLHVSVDAAFISIPDGQDMPVLELSGGEPPQVLKLADSLAQIAIAAAKDYAESKAKDVSKDDNTAVEKRESHGHTIYSETAQSPFTQIPRGRGVRLCWTAHNSCLLVAASLDALEKQLAALDERAPGFDADAILESDLEPHPLPYAMVIDVRRGLQHWFKAVLPGLIERTAGNAELQDALRGLAQYDDLFNTLPPASITFAMPADGIYECKIRSPLPFIPMVAAISTITQIAIEPSRPAEAAEPAGAGKAEQRSAK